MLKDKVNMVLDECLDILNDSNMTYEEKIGYMLAVCSVHPLIPSSFTRSDILVSVKCEMLQRKNIDPSVGVGDK